MLDTARPLQTTHLSSALAGQSRLRPGHGRARRTIVSSLMLTSLVDAFSILVIFLIVNTAGNQDVVNLGKLALPQAVESEFIQTGTVVRIENNQFIVDEKPVELGNLAAAFSAIHSGGESAKKEGLIIVADRSLDYEALSPVILAGSQAGFTKFKFAVIRK